MRIKFYGSSDDNFCFEIDGRADEWGCYQSGDELVHATAQVATLGASQRVLVHGIYDGTWSFAVAKLEDERLPNWAYSLGERHGYSMMLVIDTGAELVEVVRVEQQGGDWVPKKDD